MSDRQKNLVATIESVFPDAEIRAKHVYINFRKQLSSELLRQIFWKAARATNKHDFQVALDDFIQVNAAAHKWLINSDPTTCAAHSFDPFFKTNDITNNRTESL